MSPAPATAPRWRTPESLAEEVGVAYKTVLAWIRTGELRALPVGCDPTRGPYRVRPADWQQFVDARWHALTAPAHETAKVRRARSSSSSDHARQRTGRPAKSSRTPLIVPR